MIWAACYLGFFGFLRVSEFTIPAQDQYDQSCHLSFNDVSLDSQDNPQMLRVSIKQSKTDPFCKGVDIHLGATGHSLCPIRGILPYLTLIGSCRAPLFLLEGGRGLTRQLFTISLDNLLSELKRDTRNYSTHSFQISTATSAKTANIPDAFIKMMGRRRSDIYQRYIKTSPGELAKLSKYLLTGYQQLEVDAPTK